MSQEEPLDVSKVLAAVSLLSWSLFKTLKLYSSGRTGASTAVALCIVPVRIILPKVLGSYLQLASVCFLCGLLLRLLHQLVKFILRKQAPWHGGHDLVGNGSIQTLPKQ